MNTKSPYAFLFKNKEEVSLNIQPISLDSQSSIALLFNSSPVHIIKIKNNKYCNSKQLNSHFHHSGKESKKVNFVILIIDYNSTKDLKNAFNIVVIYPGRPKNARKQTVCCWESNKKEPHVDYGHTNLIYICRCLGIVFDLITV